MIQSSLQDNKEIYQSLNELKGAKDNRISDTVLKALNYFYSK